MRGLEHYALKPDDVKEFIIYMAHGGHIPEEHHWGRVYVACRECWRRQIREMVKCYAGSK
jgi:hypothetical protein